ncbi:MAG TPA: universal stress protein, partial [Bryobacteraceae bacterium]|nr:universal stress protein [Bryobacteraceae bacterium]
MPATDHLPPHESSPDVKGASVHDRRAPFRRILFPVDFSIPCDQMAPSVAAVQEAMGAGLVLLHSLYPDRSWPANGGTEWKLLQQKTEEHLKAFAAAHFAAGRPDLVLETGEPAAAISRSVEARHIDLVMMPTHGYGLFRRAVLGSVTTRLLHHVGCAIWTASHAEAQGSPAVRNILYGLEDPACGAALLASAAHIAHTLGATLTIVHAYPDFSGTSAACYERHIPRRTEAVIRRKLTNLQTAAGTSAPVVIAGGEVDYVIAETARRRHADLVILGRGSFGGFLDSIGSHLYFVIRSSPCPVLV